MTEFKPYAFMILFHYDNNNNIVGTNYKFYVNEKEKWPEQLELLNLTEYQKDNFWNKINNELNQ